MDNVDKEHREKIMEMIEKAGSEEYETSWNEAGVFSTSKKKSNVKKGRTSKARGARFELKVREDLEKKGRVVDKWTNNVDLSPRDDSSKDDSGEPSGEPKSKLVIAKRKYNPYSKALTIGTGFPDFISIKHIHEGVYSVIGVEVKMTGTLSKIEKEKCAWYLQKKIFSAIWIAKKGEERGAPKGVSQGGTRTSTRPRDISEEISTRGKIIYDDFAEKYGEKYNKT